MYKLITIGGKDYKLEYSVEAALYGDCGEAASTLLFGSVDSMSKKDTSGAIKIFANLPQAALTMFYAGLMEHHGIDGDKTVTNKDDAKRLLKQYLEEHKDDETGDFYGLTGMLMEQMGEDNFFKQIGLEGLLNAPEEKGEAIPKIPQDHKPRARKASAK